MSRDSNLVKRNAFVIPGGLLAAACLAGILYGMTIRPDGHECDTGARMLLWGLCYHVATVLAPPFVLGVALVVLGAIRYHAPPDDLEGHLHFGTWTHLTLAILIAVVGLPFLVWFILKILESSGDLYVIQMVGVEFELTFLLELMILLGILMLGPFLGLYIAQGMMRKRFLAEAQAMAAGGDDEEFDEEEPDADDAEGAFSPLPEDTSTHDALGSPEEPGIEVAPAEVESGWKPLPKPEKVRAEDSIGNDPLAAPLADEDEEE